MFRRSRISLTRRLRVVLCRHECSANRQFDSSRTGVRKNLLAERSADPSFFPTVQKTIQGHRWRCSVATREDGRATGRWYGRQKCAHPTRKERAVADVQGKEHRGGNNPIPLQVSAVCRPALHSRFSSELCGPHKNGWNVTELDGRRRPTDGC